MSGASPSHTARGRDLVRLGLTLAIGTAGGFLADQVDIPLAWMLGAMVATTLGAVLGLPLLKPGRIQLAVMPILGLMLGSAFTADTVSQALEWLPSLVTLVIYVIISTWVIFLVVQRVANMGPTTALFSSSPDGFGEMLLMGEAMGGDGRQISLIHSVRIFIVVSAVPLWFTFSSGYEAGAKAELAGIADLALKDVGILAAAAVLGYAGGAALRIPAAPLIGPTVLSALVHALGWTQAQPPGEFIAIAQVVIGSSVGSRFAGFPLRQALRVLATGAGTTIFMLIFALLAALGLEAATGFPFAVIWLAFIPGGLAEMTLISLSIGTDTAFVSTHHMVRMLFMVAAAPLIYRWLSRHRDMSEGPPG